MVWNKLFEEPNSHVHRILWSRQNDSHGPVQEMLRSFVNLGNKNRPDISILDVLNCSSHWYVSSATHSSNALLISLNVPLILPSDHPESNRYSRMACLIAVGVSLLDRCRILSSISGGRFPTARNTTNLAPMLSELIKSRT